MDDGELEQESIQLLIPILNPEKHSFKIVRSKFEKLIGENQALIDLWYKEGDFRTMKLYNLLVSMGYRKRNHILKKVE